jgi:chromosome segregation protein
MKKLSLDKRELKAEFDALSDEKSSRGTSLDAVSSQLESNRNDLLGIEHQLTQIGNEVYALSEAAHRLEREISILGEKKSNASLLIGRNESDLADYARRTAELNGERENLLVLKETQTLELQKLERQLADAREKQGQADRQLLNARVAREAENKKLLDLEGRLSSGMAEESSLKEQTEELADMAHQAEVALAEGLPKQKELIAQIEQEREKLHDLNRRRSDLEVRKGELAAEMERRVDRGEELSLELSDLKASLEACEARRNLLEDMMLHYEGHESGVVAAMEASERWPQLVGTVADCFVPVAGMEQVLESALGEMARYIICRDRRSAEQVIDYLRSEGKGRVGILVPHSGTLTPGVKRPEIDIPGVVGWLDNYVSTDEHLRPLMEAVLSRTLVFEPNADTDAILKHLPFGFGAVTTEGVLYRNNLIFGGSTDELPLFRRKEKIAEQDELITELKEKIGVSEAKKNRNTARVGELRAESGTVASELEEILERQEEQQRKLSEAEFENRSLITEFDRLKREKQNLTQRLESVRGRQYSLGLGSSQLASQKENLVNSLQVAGDRLDDLEAAAARSASEVSNLQVSGIEARSWVAQTEHRVAHLDELLADLERSRTIKSSEIETARQDIVGGDETMDRLEQELKAAFDRRDQRIASQDELRVQQTALMEQTTAKELEVKQIRQAKDSVSERLHGTDIRLTSIESEIKALVDRMRQDYEIDITQVDAVRPEEGGAGITDEQIPEHVANLKETIRNFGAVNLLALEEYEAASERENFLSVQLTDLTKAKNDLRSTITKINQTARQLFNDTFEKVQKNFSKLFVDLFAGGEARISMVDPDDPLESDIEIIARPGGKKLLPITMLSGGERALTAISLLFSLYLVKPSPFCILDEIDAPLDDANCQRFLKIIHTFSQQTQFIVITHNKITMEAADNLYGITMERPGVSKLVAVRFAASADGSAEDLVEIEHDEIEGGAVPGLEDLPEAIQERINPSVSVKPDQEN